FNSNPQGEIPGSMAFELYDTFGFPIDLTELIAREEGYTVDLAGFQEALNEQKQRSKADAKKDLGDWNWMVEDAEENFVGYDQTKARTRITRWRSVEHKGKRNYQMILENSPFYAESGGQIGDAGELNFENGETLPIHDTQKENKLHILTTSKEPSSFEGEVNAKVSERRRQWIACNHSATHLLHSALRSVLGDHVAQKGSLVTDKALRFDFSHFGKMSSDEIKEVETIVNQKIREGINLIEHRNMPIEEAKKMGAMALFGEKYGESVRVIVFDKAYSVELCGGTHVPNTSEISLFKITSEGSISSGVRRIEAITSDLAWKDLNQKMEALEQINDKLQRPKDLVQSIDKLLEQQVQLKKKVESFELQMISDAYEDLKSKAEMVDQKVFLIQKLTLPHADAAKQICFQLKDHFDSLCCVLGYVANEKPGIAIYIDPALVKANDWNASKMVRELGKHIQGGGGGQDFYATAGGKNTDGLSTALEAARALLLN
ncbi:alanine--tRNA ligase-related protein, partial [Bacteroidia bacterium]|nr:alanine--tRNA ligase-related protein [Bacteroidia bacterium]